jgi:hypothetical protein
MIQQNLKQMLCVQVSSVNGQDQLTLKQSVLHPTITTSWDAFAGKLKLFSPSGITVPHTDFVSAIKDVVYTNSSTNPSGIVKFPLPWTSQLPSVDRSLLSSYFWDYRTNAKNSKKRLIIMALRGYLATILWVRQQNIRGTSSRCRMDLRKRRAETEGVWKWVTGPAIDRVVFGMVL